MSHCLTGITLKFTFRLVPVYWTYSMLLGLGTLAIVHART